MNWELVVFVALKLSFSFLFDCSHTLRLALFGHSLHFQYFGGCKLNDE